MRQVRLLRAGKLSTAWYCDLMPAESPITLEYLTLTVSPDHSQDGYAKLGISMDFHIFKQASNTLLPSPASWSTLQQRISWPKHWIKCQIAIDSNGRHAESIQEPFVSEQTLATTTGHTAGLQSFRRRVYTLGSLLNPSANFQGTAPFENRYYYVH